MNTSNRGKLRAFRSENLGKSGCPYLDLQQAEKIFALGQAPCTPLRNREIRGAEISKIREQRTENRAAEQQRSSIPRTTGTLQRTRTQQPKTDAVVAARRRVVVAERRTTAVGVGVPRATTQNTRRPGGCALRVVLPILRVFAVPVPKPLPHIARQITDTVRRVSARVQTHRSRMTDTPTIIHPAGVGILITPGIAASVHSARGALPLGFGGQLTALPGGAGGRLEPTDLDHRPLVRNRVLLRCFLTHANDFSQRLVLWQMWQPRVFPGSPRRHGQPQSKGAKPHSTDSGSPMRVFPLLEPNCRWVAFHRELLIVRLSNHGFLQRNGCRINEHFANFLPTTGHPSRSCPHLVLGFLRSPLAYCLSEEVRSRTGDLHPIRGMPCQAYPIGERGAADNAGIEIRVSWWRPRGSVTFGPEFRSVPWNCCQPVGRGDTETLGPV